jgi:NADPH:quinone reductase-like Zn-dependent oxidoreductase
MLAGTFSRYGDLANLNMNEVPTPEPGDSQVRVKIRAVGLNDTDYGLITGKPLFTRLFVGLRRPRRAPRLAPRIRRT